MRLISTFKTKMQYFHQSINHMTVKCVDISLSLSLSLSLCLSLSLSPSLPSSLPLPLPLPLSYTTSLTLSDTQYHAYGPSDCTMSLCTSSPLMFSGSGTVAAVSTVNGSICNSCNKFLIASSSTGFGGFSSSDSRASLESFYKKKFYNTIVKRSQVLLLIRTVYHYIILKLRPLRIKI